MTAERQPRILRPEARPTSDVPYHYDRAPGQKYLIVDRAIASETPVYVALRRVPGVPDDQPIWLDRHAHNCESFYVFLGDGPALEGLHGVVEISGEETAVESPAAVTIPPLLLHRYWLTHGCGWYLQITSAPTYEESLIDEMSTRARHARPPRDDDVPRIGRAGANGWTLLEPTARSGGIGIDVVDLARARLESMAEAASGVVIDVICGKEGAPAPIDVTIEGEQRTLVAPVALMSDAASLSYEIDRGNAVAVRISVGKDTRDTQSKEALMAGGGNLDGND